VTGTATTGAPIGIGKGTSTEPDPRLLQRVSAAATEPKATAPARVTLTTTSPMAVPTTVATRPQTSPRRSGEDATSPRSTAVDTDASGMASSPSTGPVTDRDTWGAGFTGLTALETTPLTRW
jgi:hypothetical protein